MERDKLNIVWEKIEELTKKDKQTKLKLKKLKRSEKILEPLIYVTCLSVLFATYSPFLLKKRYNIYEGQNLTIDKTAATNIISNLEDELDKSISSSNVDSYLLLDAVSKNTKLTIEEKEHFYDLVNIIKDNPYLNKEETYTNLLNLDIEYVENRREIDGEWNPFSYHIKIDNNLEDAREKEVISHEIIHSFFESFSSLSSLPKMHYKPQFMKEGMCEILTLEYANKTDYSMGCYVLYVTFVKMLCEIVGSDVMLQSYSTSDMSYVYNAMADIKGTKDDAKRLIENMDTLLEHACKKKLDVNDETVFVNVHKNIKKLDDYYDKKTNKDKLLQDAENNYYLTDDCSEILSIIETFDEKHDFYYYNRSLLESIIFKKGSESLYATGIYAHKAYFSTELKNNCDNPYIELVSIDQDEKVKVKK